MLSKKQYRFTLIAAIVAFIVTLCTTAWYYSQKGWDVQQYEQVQPQEKETEQQAEESVKEPVILPHTKISLKIKDLTTHKVDKTTIDPVSLLGLNEREIKDRFDDYTVEAFSEKEVTLSRTMISKPGEDKPITYVLGVEGEEICIKARDQVIRPIRIDYKVDHLSKYVYSLLLNEEIEITREQKEALLLNPSRLQKILQDYVGE